MKDFLGQVRESVLQRFEQSRRLLSFQEYLQVALEHPYCAVRPSSHYLLDAIDHFGVEEVSIRGKPVKRYKIFDQHFSEAPQPLVGHETIQQQLIQIVTNFVRSTKNDKLVVLHGPNGSAKSTLIRNLLEGMEHYSTLDAGLMFHFSWIFPEGSLEKPGLGIGAKRENTEHLDSFAKLEQDKIGSIVRSELHENPLYLIPREERSLLFTELMGHATGDATKQRLEQLEDTFLKGELSHKNALIFDALMSDYNGDYKKLLRHVRIERMFLSRRFRQGLVTIEPQFGVDAGMRQVTLDRSMANLPPALQSLNLFQLEGDLVDGNRGLIEYNDFLKRPIEHSKYLLGTCESGTVNLGHIVVYLDSVFIASTNDRQLEAFREHPEYNSFKARLELIKVPYLLRFSEEEKIYRNTAKNAAGPKELMPHTTRLLALWAVLTRIKRPLTKNKSSMLVKILENLTPLHKAKLYDNGEIPDTLTDEERRELKNHIDELQTEHQNQPYYEGLLGASARELKVVLQIASQNEQYPTLGPNAVFAELKRLVKRPMDFEYLRQEPISGYHDFDGMIGTVRNEWLQIVDREMRQSLEMQNDSQFRDMLGQYVKHVMAFVRGDKIKNKHTGQQEDANESVMRNFEDFISFTGNASEHRKNLISRLGAWSIEHPGRDLTKSLPFEEIFPDIMERIENRFHESQVTKIRAMGGFILDVSSFDQAIGTKVDEQKLSEPAAMALRAYEGLKDRFHYGPNSAKEALVELMKSRYLNTP